MNPLLQLDGLPDFAALKPEHIRPAISQILTDCRERLVAIERLPESAVTWENTAEALTNLNERLGRAWGVVSHCHSVCDTPEWREQYNAMLPEVAQFFAELAQNHAVFVRLQAIRSSAQYDALLPAQKTCLEHDLRDFRLGGALLDAAQKSELLALDNEATVLSSQFAQNVMDATDAFGLYFDDNAPELAGLPEDALAMMRDAARAEDRDGVKICLHMPHYLAVMQNAADRKLRETIYRAYTTRASELDAPERDNTPVITRLLEVARQKSTLLGFETPAHRSLESKMAESPQQVLDFIRHLARRARVFAQKDLDELRDFAREHLQIDTLQAWDVTYAAEQMRRRLYDFSEEEVKSYFPADRVMRGLFDLIFELYGVNFQAATASVWHDSVNYYTLMREGEEIGGLYVDLYARGGKRGGAWMDDYRGRRVKNGCLQTPVAYLNCNFTPPAAGRTSLLAHDDVITLFHEMGHALHHLLTRVDELGVSGINGVEWDAVELPSQFMENFAWEYDVLCRLSQNAQGDVLPETLFEKMQAAKNFHSGLFLVRQMEFALFDMLVYTDATRPWQQLLTDARNETAVIFPPEYNRFAHSFSHIFAGGYSAGYYSYAWAEVLCADAYAAFKEWGREKAGAKFLDEILAVGGSRPAAESYRAFRGRDADADALLRSRGLI